MNDDQSILVRCQCGYIMRRVPEQPRMGETWKCYTWHHRTAPEKLNYCPICGVAPSNLSTTVLAANVWRNALEGTMSP